MTINSILIPEKIQPIVMLQEKILCIDSTNVSETVKWVIESRNFLSYCEMKTLAFEIYWIYTIRPKILPYIVQFCIEIFRIHPQGSLIKSLLLEIAIQRAPILIRSLLMEQCYEIKDIMEKLRTTYLFISIFVFSRDIPNIENFLGSFNDSVLLDTLEKYQSDNWRLLNEYTKYGWPKQSIGYLLKNDMINELKEYLDRNEIIITQEVDWSNFEIYQKPKICDMLNIAAIYGSYNCFTFLLGKGSKISNETCRCSIIGGNLELFGICCEHCSDLSGCILAAAHFRRDILFDRLIDLGYKSEINLALFVEFNYLKSSLYCVANGQSVNDEVDNGWTPLHSASNSENLHLAEFLIDNGADLNKSDSDGWAPIHWSVDRGNLEITKLLVERGANINALDGYGWTPLHWTAQYGHFEVSKFLVENGANVNIIADNGCTPLHRACINGYFNIVVLLVENGAALNIKEQFVYLFLLEELHLKRQPKMSIMMLSLI